MATRPAPCCDVAMPTIAAVVALALAATRPEARSSLEGCRATPLDHGWQYDCQGLSARLEDKPGAVGSAYLDGVEGAVVAVLGEGAQRTRERRKVGGEEVELRRAQSRDKAVTAWIGALPRPAGTRIVGCWTAGAAARCAAMLDALATTAWGSGRAAGTVLQEAPTLTLAGRKVDVPSGCEGKPQPNGAGRVECPPAFFVMWAPVNDDAQARRTMDEYGNWMAAKMNRPELHARRDAAPCRLGGVETTCSRLRIAPEGHPVAILWGTARVSGQLLFGSCMAPDRTALPPPCSVLFGYR